MNTFKRKALFTAVLAGLGVMSIGAEASYANPNSGQVLIYPYYNVSSAQSPYHDYIAVITKSWESTAAPKMGAVVHPTMSGGLSLGQSYTNAGVLYASYTYRLRI